MLLLSLLAPITPSKSCFFPAIWIRGYEHSSLP